MMQEFKIGDWVRDTRQGMKNPIVQLKSNCIALTNPKEYATQYELWQPKEGEWCWFWNSALGIWFISTLKDFGEYNNSIQYRCNSVYYICEKCEPFIGELPTSLQH